VAAPALAAAQAPAAAQAMQAAASQDQPAMESAVDSRRVPAAQPILVAEVGYMC